MSAPKKFTDATRSEITQEWKDWFALQQEDRKEDLKDRCADLGYPEETYWPEDFDKDVGEGAWILVVEEPNTGLRKDFRVPTPSLWYAKPDPTGHRFSLGSGQMEVHSPPAYRVTIQTPGGTLWLWPHEYVMCSDPMPLITDPECTIHTLGGRAPVDEEQLFYLQSRGWSQKDAVLALLEGLDASEWGWVEFPEYARAVFEGVGARIRIAG